MTMIMELVVAVPAVGLLAWGLRRFGAAFAGFRGRRLVACPETGQPAAVELAAWRLAGLAILRRPALRLRDCSRWHERGACGQPCLSQIEASPQECLVRRIVMTWYEDRSCTFCGRPLGRIDWSPHKPCLVSPERSLLEWKDIQPERIPLVLATHQPVCRTCFIAETHIP